MVSTRRLVSCVALALVTHGCGGGSGGSGGGGDNPAIIGPSSVGLSGTWTGSLSRPGALGSVAVRWQGNHQGQSFTGPATFTYNGVSVAGTIGGQIAGSPATWLAEIAFTDPALPNCKAERSTVIAGPGANVPNLTTTATVMTSVPFAIRYNNCQTFIGQATVDEMSQLTLNKQ